MFPNTGTLCANTKYECTSYNAVDGKAFFFVQISAANYNKIYKKDFFVYVSMFRRFSV